MRNVNQAVDTRNDAGKSTIRGHGNDGRLDNRLDRIIAFQNLPRIVLRLFEAKRNLFLLGVDILDIHLDRVADIYHFGRMLDTRPGEFRYMNHTIHTAKIDKSAVTGQALDHAGVGLANLNLAPELLRQRLALFAQNSTDRPYHAAAAINLQNLEFNRPALKKTQIFPAGQSRLRGRNEHTAPFSHGDNAAVVYIGDNAGENRILLFCGQDLIPAKAGVVPLFGKGDRPLLIIGTHDDQIQFVADLDRLGQLNIGVVRKFARGNISGMFSADIHLNLSRVDRQDHTTDLLVRIQAVERGLKCLLKGHFLKRFFRLYSLGCGFDRLAALDDFVVQNLGHGFYYLLYYAGWRGSPGGNPDFFGAEKHVPAKFSSRLDQIGARTEGGADLPQFYGIGTVPTADHDHPVARGRKRLGFFLPIGSCTTYCIKNNRVCTYLF